MSLVKIATIAAVCSAILVAAAAERVLAPFNHVRPVLEVMRDQLPSALRNPDEARWDAWSRRQDSEIRARLEQGEIDSMINLLLFGNSFTKRPRIQFESLTEASKSGVLRSRVEDLLQGLRSPGDNERLLFLRNLMRQQGLDPNSDDGKTGLFVFQNLQRVLQENACPAPNVNCEKGFVYRKPGRSGTQRGGPSHPVKYQSNSRKRCFQLQYLLVGLASSQSNADSPQ
jgi:hypothetical protein